MLKVVRGSPTYCHEDVVEGLRQPSHPRAISTSCMLYGLGVLSRAKQVKPNQKQLLREWLNTIMMKAVSVINKLQANGEITVDVTTTAAFQIVHGNGILKGFDAVLNQSRILKRRWDSQHGANAASNPTFLELFWFLVDFKRLGFLGAQQKSLVQNLRKNCLVIFASLYEQYIQRVWAQEHRIDVLPPVLRADGANGRRTSKRPRLLDPEVGFRIVCGSRGLTSPIWRQTVLDCLFLPFRTKIEII